MSFPAFGPSQSQYFELGSRTDRSSSDTVFMAVSINAEANAPLATYRELVSDVPVLLAFCAYLGSDDNRFQVRRKDLAGLQVIKTRYGSPFDVLLECEATPYAIYILAGSYLLPKILERVSVAAKNLADARNANQQALDRKALRERSDAYVKTLSQALRESLPDVDKKTQRQLRKLIDRLDSPARPVKLAEALVELATRKTKLHVVHAKPRARATTKK